MAADSFVQMLLQLECKWNVNEPVFFAEFKDCEYLGKPLTQYGSKFLASERWGYRAKPELIGKLVDVRCPVLHPGAKEALLRFKVPPEHLHTSGPLTRAHTPRWCQVPRRVCTCATLVPGAAACVRVCHAGAGCRGVCARVPRRCCATLLVPGAAACVRVCRAGAGCRGVRARVPR
eukprot:SAG11_NODE_6427_length_1315_cov_2.686678_2_plen_176_part_00